MKKRNAKELSLPSVALLCFKWSESRSVVSDSLRPHACWASLSKEFSRQEHWSGWLFPSPGDLPNPGTEPKSPALQADSLPSESPEKPKTTGVGSLSLNQIFQTQESNQGLPHLQADSLRDELTGKPIINTECECDQSHGTKLTENEFQGMPRRVSGKDS